MMREIRENKVKREDWENERESKREVERVG